MFLFLGSLIEARSATVESEVEGRQDGPSVSVVPPRAAGSLERPLKKSKRCHSQAEEGELSDES